MKIGKKHVAYLALGLMLATVILLAASPLIGVRFDVILSGSMSPAMRTGDLAIVTSTEAESLQVGDVIVFVSPLGGGLVCHRIIAVNDGPELSFQTKGDNNEDPDPFTVQSSNVVGKVSASAPYMGYVVQWLRGPFGLLAILAMLGAVILFPSKSSDKERAKEDVNAGSEIRD